MSKLIEIKDVEGGEQIIAELAALWDESMDRSQLAFNATMLSIISQIIIAGNSRTADRRASLEIFKKEISERMDEFMAQIQEVD